MHCSGQTEASLPVHLPSVSIGRGWRLYDPQGWQEGRQVSSQAFTQDKGAFHMHTNIFGFYIQKDICQGRTDMYKK